MTGIGRKEVRRLRQLAARYPDNPRVELSPLSDVLQRWYTDPVYLSPNGLPKRLQYQGGKPSFSTLVKACAGDLPVGAIRVELIRTGAVVVDAEGGMLPKRRHSVPDSLDDSTITGMVFGLRALASTVAFNSQNTVTRLGRIERFAESNPVADGVDLDEVRSQLRARIADFAVGVDDFLSKVDQSSDSSAKRVGVGVYYYEDD
jgi:hypothetical protein